MLVVLVEPNLEIHLEIVQMEMVAMVECDQEKAAQEHLGQGMETFNL